MDETIAECRESAAEIVDLLTGPKVKPSEVSDAQGRAQEIATTLYGYRMSALIDDPQEEADDGG